MTAPYRSFLLRFWLESNDPPAWRAMLESTSTGKRYGFNSIEALLLFLSQETDLLEQEFVSNPKNDFASNNPIKND